MTTPTSSPTPLWTAAPLAAASYVNSVAVSADGGTVVGGTFKHTYPKSQAARHGAPEVAPVAEVDATTPNQGMFCYNGSNGSLRWKDEIVSTEGVYWVAVSADGSRAAAGGLSINGSPGGFVRAYDAITGALLLDHATDKRVNQVALSADGEWLIAGSRSVMLFKYSSITSQYELTGEIARGCEVLSVGISADGNTLVHCDLNGAIVLACNEGGKIATNATFTVPPSNSTEHPHFCHMLSLAADGSSFAAGGANGQFYLFESSAFKQSNQPTQTYSTGGTGAIYGVAGGSDGRLFAGVANTADTGEVYLVNGATLLKSFPTERNPNCVIINSTHGLMAVADGHPDGTPGHFYLFDINGGLLTEKWRFTTGNMSWPITIAANGSMVVGGSDDGHIYALPVS